MDIISLILILGLISGQLVKVSIIGLGVTILDIIVIIIYVIGLIKLKFRLKTPPLFIKSALFFISISIISLIFSPLNLTPLQKLSSFVYSVRLFDLILLGWLIYSSAFQEMRKNITHIVIYSGLILSIAGITQLIFIPDLGFLSTYGWDPHYFRVVSTFLDPNYLGVYLVLTLLLLYHHFREGVSQVNKFIKITFTIVYIALFTTFSRSAYLMFIISFVILTILNKSVRLGILTIILSLGLVFGFLSYDKIIAQPKNINRLQSAEYRLDSWQQGVRMFTENPLLGVGYNTYRYALEKYQLADQSFINSRGASSNDSSLLFVAATTGTVGFTAYILFLGTLLWINRKNYIFVSGLIGLIIVSFFINTLFYPFILIWVILYSISKKAE